MAILRFGLCESPADELLAATLDKTNPRMELNLEPRDVVLVEPEGDDAG